VHPRRRIRSAQVAAATPTNHPVAAIRCARKRNEHGVTLIEALIVVALIALIAGLSFPAVTSGLDTLRLRSTSDAIVSFLNVALDRADRRQQAVEVIVSPRDNTMLSRTADLGFQRTLEMPAQVRIVSVLPPLPISIDPQQPRHFLLYPGGSVPGIGIEITTLQGRKRIVSVDPVTGSPKAEALP
jgi:type II secretory pathway pseudopilin PulG